MIQPMDASFRPAAVYLAARGFEKELAHELQARQPGCIVEQRERLFLSSAPPLDAAWAQNVWLEPFFLPIASVGDAVRQLKAIQRNWHCHPVDLHRRAALIADQLPRSRRAPCVSATGPLLLLLVPGLSGNAISSCFPHAVHRPFPTGKPVSRKIRSTRPAGPTSSCGRPLPFWMRDRRRVRCVLISGPLRAAGAGFSVRWERVFLPWTRPRLPETSWSCAAWTGAGEAVFRSRPT